MYSLTCRLSSTSAKYKASTQRQIQHKNSTNKPKENIKQREIISQQSKRKQYQKRAGTKTPNPEKHRQFNYKMQQIRADSVRLKSSVF